MKHVMMDVIGFFAPVALLALPAHAQAVRNYDCAKVGNADKAVCKSAAAAAKPAPRLAAARNYDCSKAGNANKAVCKTAMPAARPTPMTASVSTARTTRHYDCTKSGNANKSVCKGTPPAAPPVPAATTTYSRAVTQSRRTATTTGNVTSAGGPNRATAKCRDGSLSFSAHRSGTCSRHGGVAQFY